MQPDRIAPEGAQPLDPTIAVVLSREQAWTTSRSLVDALRSEIDDLSGFLESTGRCAGIDAQSTGRRVVQYLGALEAVGYPHVHEWEGCHFTLSERELDAAGPWGRG